MTPGPATTPGGLPSGAVAVTPGVPPPLPARCRSTARHPLQPASPPPLQLPVKVDAGGVPAGAILVGYVPAGVTPGPPSQLGGLPTGAVAVGPGDVPPSGSTPVFAVPPATLGLNPSAFGGGGGAGAAGATGPVPPPPATALAGGGFGPPVRVAGDAVPPGAQLVAYVPRGVTPGPPLTPGGVPTGIVPLAPGAAPPEGATPVYLPPRGGTGTVIPVNSTSSSPPPGTTLVGYVPAGVTPGPPAVTGGLPSGALPVPAGGERAGGRNTRVRAAGSRRGARPGRWLRPPGRPHGGVRACWRHARPPRHTGWPAKWGGAAAPGWARAGQRDARLRPTTRVGRLCLLHPAATRPAQRHRARGGEAGGVRACRRDARAAGRGGRRVADGRAAAAARRAGARRGDPDLRPASGCPCSLVRQR